IARAIVLTHVEAENADFDKALQDLQAAFGDVVVPITYPDGSGNRFQSVHDVFGDGGPRAKEFRDKLEERVAEADDALLERYLETGTLDPQAVLDNLAAAVTRGKLVPLFVVSPPKMLGVEQLLARLPSMLPSPIAYGP